MKTVLHRAVLALVLLVVTRGAVQAQRPLNLDFETPGVNNDGHPWGWTLGWSAFTTGSSATFEMDSLTVREGRRSFRISSPDSSAMPALTLQLPAAFARGHSIQLAGYLRGHRLGKGAFFTLEAWRHHAFAAADTAFLPGQADTGWVRHQLTIAVPDDRDVHSIVVAVAVDGAGDAWFDDFVLTVDGRPIASLPLIPTPPTPAEFAWVETHARPIRSLHYRQDQPDDDLGPFGRMVGSARIVALGESTHGTREFFQLKHRLLDYLVRRFDFRVFAIEANQVAVRQVNRYVLGGPGSAEEAMRVMFRVWNTEEVKGLVEWMREYNRRNPDWPVQFAGFDMQDHRTPYDSLAAFLEEQEPALVPVLARLLGEYRHQPAFATPQLADSVRARWAGQADSLWSQMGERRGAWLSTAGRRVDTLRVEWALQSANLLRQAARLNGSLNSPDRDSLMAANLDWYLRFIAPEASAALWAHDVHISQGGDAELSFNGGAQMGAFLARMYPGQYRAISLLTYEGAYSATRTFTDHRIIEARAFPGPANSLEGIMHRLPRRAGYFLDLQEGRGNSPGGWLEEPRPIRHIGYAAYDYGFDFQASLPLEFDGVFFVDRTSASRLLR